MYMMWGVYYGAAECTYWVSLWGYPYRTSYSHRSCQMRACRKIVAPKHHASNPNPETINLRCVYGDSEQLG